MADLAKIVDELSTLSVLEAADLVKLLEAKWGVSAAAPVAVAAAVVADTAVTVTVSRSFASSPTWAGWKPRPWPRPLAPKSSPLLARTPPRMPRPSSKPPVALSISLN